MDAALVGAAALMGLAGAPHCAAMCGAPCAALTRAEPRALAAWQLGRLGSYAAAGVVAAASVQVFAALGQALPALRALWVLAQAGVFAFGLFLVLAGRWPAWAALRWQRDSAPVVVAMPARAGGAGGLLAGAAPRAFGFGTLWALVPCGLLQSALLVAALANTPTGGAFAMAAFALASAAGPWLAPTLLRRLAGPRTGATQLPTRAAGALLAAASGWALGHGVWQQILVWCSPAAAAL